MSAPTALEIEARIDALSEQYADYLSEEQLARFWALYGRSKDASLIYLEQCVDALPARKTNYVQRADHGRAAQLTPWEVCPDCGEPTPRRNSLGGRCGPCQGLRARARNRIRKQTKPTPAPLQKQCPACRQWFDGALPKRHQNRAGYVCGRAVPTNVGLRAGHKKPRQERAV